MECTTLQIVHTQPAVASLASRIRCNPAGVTGKIETGQSRPSQIELPAYPGRSTAYFDSQLFTHPIISYHFLSFLVFTYRELIPFSNLLLVSSLFFFLSSLFFLVFLPMWFFLQRILDQYI